MEMGHLTKLTELYLSWNYLYGSIPPELGALTKMGKLEIIGNAVTGSIPETLCNEDVEFNVGNIIDCICCS
jgi:hypothetical protein